MIRLIARNPIFSSRQRNVLYSTLRFASNNKGPKPKFTDEHRKTIILSGKCALGILLLLWLNDKWVSNVHAGREATIIKQSKERSATSRISVTPSMERTQGERQHTVQSSTFTDHGRISDGSHPEVTSKLAYYNDSSRHIHNMEKTVVHMYDMQSAARLDLQHFDGRTTSLAGPKRSRNNWSQFPDSMVPAAKREEMKKQKAEEKKIAWSKYQKEKKEGKNPSIAHDRRMKRMDEKQRKEEWAKREESKKRLKPDAAIVSHPKKLYT